jgi:hypothetical protein
MPIPLVGVVRSPDYRNGYNPRPKKIDHYRSHSESAAIIKTSKIPSGLAMMPVAALHRKFF